jgi:hypothetical protein
VIIQFLNPNFQFPAHIFIFFSAVFPLEMLF